MSSSRSSSWDSRKRRPVAVARSVPTASSPSMCVPLSTWTLSTSSPPCEAALDATSLARRADPSPTHRPVVCSLSARPAHVVSPISNVASSGTIADSPRSVPVDAVRLPSRATRKVASSPAKCTCVPLFCSVVLMGGIERPIVVLPRNPTSAVSRATSATPVSAWKSCSPGMADASTTNSALPQPSPPRPPSGTGPWCSVTTPVSVVWYVSSRSASIAATGGGVRNVASKVTIAVLLNQPVAQSSNETTKTASGASDSPISLRLGSSRDLARAPNTGGRTRTAATTMIAAKIAMRLAMGVGPGSERSPYVRGRADATGWSADKAGAAYGQGRL